VIQQKSHVLHAIKDIILPKEFVKLVILYMNVQLVKKVKNIVQIAIMAIILLVEFVILVHSKVIVPSVNLTKYHAQNAS